jgi:uncharacterized protein YkwD
MARIIFTSFLIIVFLNQNLFSQTKIRFVNNTNELVSAAYAKYINEIDGWKSFGWFNIKVGASMDINLGDYAYSNVYIYGFNKSNYWGKGQYQFCVDTKNGFSIANADANCDFTKKTFSEFKITSNKVNTWNFGQPKNNNTNNNNTSKNLNQQQINEFVSRHNYWRTEIGSPDMVWSESLAQYAYEWAKYLADNNLFEHRSPNKYGENIFMCYNCTNKTYTPSTVVDDWASEKSLYNGETISNSNFSAFGHYTQVVWCQTTQVGCAMVQSKNGNMIVVCNYAPAGNRIGSKPNCN